MAIIPSHDCDLQAKVVDFVAPNGGLYIPKLQVVSPMECVPTLLT